MPFRFYGAYTVPKDDSDANEDSWDHNGDKSICAVCDGASTSYDSKGWARLLCHEFTSDPIVTYDWIERLAARFNAGHDRDCLPWMKQAAFDRGSFSTLLGIRVIDEEGVAEVFAVGDTIVAVFDAEEFKESYPYKEAEYFDSNPTLLSTRAQENTLFTDAFLKDKQHPIRLSSFRDPIIFAMTDALGRWVLERRSDRELAELAKKFIGFDQPRFTSFILAEREEGRMRRDDTTLLIMRRT